MWDRSRKSTLRSTTSPPKGVPREQVIASRDRRVPLGKMGTGWDVGYGALFLHSDEAKFITGISLVIDGGELAAAGSQGI